MRPHLAASAAICALMAALPAAAQTDAAPSGQATPGAAPVQDDSDVFRNDLPETHDGFELPTVDAEGVPEQLAEPLGVVSAGAVTAQQFGNLASMKVAGGAVRDLGDRMVLLHGAIGERLDALGGQDEARSEAVAERMGEAAQADLAALEGLNGAAFDEGFAGWVAQAYPPQIDAWSRIGEAEGFAALSEAVLDRLRGQLSVAEAVLAGEAAPAPDEPGDTGPTGAEGQIGERQHTPEPEAPAEQTGENYQHKQVETDPQAQTRSLPDDAGQPEVAAAAGELEIVDAGLVFALIENIPTELEQLARAPEHGPEAVRVVSLAERLGPEDLSRLDEALKDHDEDLAALREEAGARPALADALSAAGRTTAQLAAIDVLDEGIVLYVRRAD